MNNRTNETSAGCRSGRQPYWHRFTQGGAQKWNKHALHAEQSDNSVNDLPQSFQRPVVMFNA